MKKFIFIFITFSLVVGFLTGIYIYKISSIEEDSLEYIAQVTDECTEIAELNETGLLNSQLTNNEEVKTTPNTKIIKQIYYKKCNHLIESNETVLEEEVNLSQDKIKEKYGDWEVQEFTKDKVILYKESEDFCNEHYVLREKNGFIVIYKLDENNKEFIYETTDISTEYLTQTDLIDIEKGLGIYTKQELNKILEDFE